MFNSTAQLRFAQESGNMPQPPRPRVKGALSAEPTEGARGPAAWTTGGLPLNAREPEQQCPLIKRPSLLSGDFRVFFTNKLFIIIFSGMDL